MNLKAWLCPTSLACLVDAVTLSTSEDSRETLEYLRASQRSLMMGASEIRGTPKAGAPPTIFKEFRIFADLDWGGPQLIKLSEKMALTP